MPTYDKIVVITQKTALDELVERFNTRDQARFYIEHSGQSFEEYQSAHDAYECAITRVKIALPTDMRAQFVDRAYLPNFLFAPRDFVVTLGRDGLVINTAKYLRGQPLLAFNPDPARVDGVLARFPVASAKDIFAAALRNNMPRKRITMLQATLNNGQSLLAVNDLFIGQRTHLSARYRLEWAGRGEEQSSSGIIVSTGAGSTGWFRSILAGAAGIVEGFGNRAGSLPAMTGLRDQFAFDAEADYAYFSVREPFVSRTSAAQHVFGRIDVNNALTVVSRMPQGGVIFSDGIENDHIEFTSGRIVDVTIADTKVDLVTS